MGFHGYKTFVVALVVCAGYFAGYGFGQAAAVVAGVPGLLVGLAALVGANEAANVLRARVGRPPATIVQAGAAEVTGGPVTVEEGGPGERSPFDPFPV